MNFGNAANGVDVVNSVDVVAVQNIERIELVAYRRRRCAPYQAPLLLLVVPARCTRWVFYRGLQLLHDAHN